MKQANSDKTVIFRQILGQTIAEKRIKKGISQRLFADEYEISRNLLMRIEKGIGNIQFSSYFTVGEALGIHIEDIIAESRKKLPEGYTVIDW